jgi:MEKHLA domain
MADTLAPVGSWVRRKVWDELTAVSSMSEIWQSEWVIAHTACLARSLRHFTGRELLAGSPDLLSLSQKVFESSFVLVSHGAEADPVLNYGNRAALTLWEMTWEELTRTPSRFTAEAPNREERARLLAEVTTHGFIDDYSGVRISKTGRCFRIHRATVWNLITETGQPCGQAAMFDRWQFV